MEVSGANEIDNDVYALSVSGFLDFSGPVLGMIIESSSRTELLDAEVYLFIGASGYIDCLGSVCLCKLDTSDRD